MMVYKVFLQCIKESYWTHTFIAVFKFKTKLHYYYDHIFKENKASNYLFLLTFSPSFSSISIMFRRRVFAIYLLNSGIRLSLKKIYSDISHFHLWEEMPTNINALFMYLFTPGLHSAINLNSSHLALFWGVSYHHLEWVVNVFPCHHFSLRRFLMAVVPLPAFFA